MEMALLKWERDIREIVYRHEGRTRYPSIVKTGSGKQLVLFTSQTREQEDAREGDLLLIRRSKAGRWWFGPEKIFTGENCVPRAPGTMTVLEGGRIIAPFAVLSESETKSVIRMLVSEDDGKTWNCETPEITSPFYWLMPCGRTFEYAGRLVMPVFGALSESDLQEMRHSCGLLYSSDGGGTWDAFVMTAVGNEEWSYEYPAVMPLNDGSICALVTARRADPYMDAPMVIMRTYSSDHGKTWPVPEQLCVGAWPGITKIDEETVACAYTVWCAWGEVKLLISGDGFRTFGLDQCAVEHGWLPIPSDYPKKSIYKDKELLIEEYRNYWAYNPIPLPPAVPYMKGDWKAGHYGFAAVMPDEGNLTVVLGNMQKGNVYVNPVSEQNIPVEWEGIETVSFRPLKTVRGNKPLRKAGIKDRWAVSESWSAEEYEEKTGNPLPSGAAANTGVSLVLGSGRRIRVNVKYLTDIRKAKSRIIGNQKGYWVWYEDGLHFKSEMEFSYSDDRGATWIKAPIRMPDPMTAAFQGGPMFEDNGGTLVLPVYGYLSYPDMNLSRYVSGVYRSHDRGITWGDFSIVGYDRDEGFYIFNETSIYPASDELWVAFIRTEVRTNVPWLGATMMRLESNDKGYTWSEPEPCFPGSQSAVIDLPDGGMALIVRSTGRQQNGVYFSYDHGITWDYAIAGPYNTQAAGMLDKDRFWIFAGNEVLVYKRQNVMNP